LVPGRGLFGATLADDFGSLLADQLQALQIVAEKLVLADAVLKALQMKA
jgi:hypothetical protein